jgi:DNA-directed RNA polymerase subunit alpha
LNSIQNKNMSSIKIKIDKVESGDNYAKYELGAFERGYGNTFATPLRRILLSSIKGTSLTSVTIKGVNHEFSTLKGMKEDVLRLILNLQKVVFRLSSSESEKIVLKVHGKKTIKAGDIKVPGNVVIVNPELEIAELTDDSAQFELEAVVEAGYGFVLADNEMRNAKPGTVPVNKNYSPVVKVNVNIEATRVAQKTDYEKIVLEVWTTGAVTTDEALKEASAKFLEELTGLNDVIQAYDDSAEEESVEVVEVKEEENE